MPSFGGELSELQHRASGWIIGRASSPRKVNGGPADGRTRFATGLRRTFPEILRPTDHTDTSALSKVRVAWVPPGESQLQGDYSMDSIDLGLRRDGIESWWAIA